VGAAYAKKDPPPMEGLSPATPEGLYRAGMRSAEIPLRPSHPFCLLSVMEIRPREAPPQKTPS